MSKVKWVSSYQIGIHKSEDCEVPVIPLADLAEVVEGLKRIASQTCGCYPRCQCDSESTLRVWKEEVQSEAQRLLAQLIGDKS